LPQVQQTAAPPGPLFQGWKGPLPTTTWWTGLGVGTQDSNLAGPFPYTCQGNPEGLLFGLPFHRYFDGTSIHSGYQKDILVSFKEMPKGVATNHKLLAFDELTVSVQWFSGTATLTSYLVQGSPYMTFLFNRATASIVPFSSPITSVNGMSVANNPVITEKKLKFVLQDGSVWILYSLTNPVTITASASELHTNSPFTGVVRIARLNATYSDTEALLDNYAPNYAVGANISYTINGDVALVKFNWVIGGGSADNLLQLAWAHHRALLMAGTTLRPHVQFLTVKGYQSGVVGGAWTLQYPLTDISWFAPRPVDASCKNVLASALQKDIANSRAAVPGDFYFWGKTVQGNARLAVIAEEIGRKDLISKVITDLETSFQYWISGTGSDPIAYDTVWGGAVSAKGVKDVGLDYGNGFYNDHHFHYGYHLYAAAVIARNDPDWLAKNARYVNELARDIGNPSSLDPHYPISRMKDWFAGHSWASGIGYNGGERDEESTTEAINGYHGLYMWALASGNTALADFARVLLATEIHSVQYYWHLYPDATTETPYPEAAVRALTTLGNIQSTQAGAWLWWGAQKSEIASIQLLPIHPVSEDYIDIPWARAMYAWASPEITDPNVGGGWKGYLYMAHATFDAIAAYGQAKGNTAFDSGNSLSNTIWWISTRAKTSGNPICS